MFSRFFKSFIKPKYIFSQDNLNEITSRVAEIKKLQTSGTADDLTRALIKIDDLEIKFPPLSETARFYRGEVGYDLYKKTGEENLSYSNHMRNYRPQ